MAPAINTAIGLAAARGPGAAVVLGYGAFELHTQVLFSARLGITLRGQGKEATILVINAATAAVTDGYIKVTDCYAVTLSHFSVTATASLTAARPDAIRLEGASPVRQVNTVIPTDLSTYLVNEVEIIGCYNGIHLTDTTRGPFGVWMQNLNIQPCNGGSGVWVDSQIGGMHYLTDSQINSLCPAAATPALAAIRVTGTGDLTISRVNTFQCDYGLLANPGGGALINYLRVNDSVFDTSNLNNCRIDGTPGCVIQNLDIAGTWFATVLTATGGGFCVYIGQGVTAGKLHSCRASNGDLTVGGGFIVNTGANRVTLRDCNYKGPGHIGFALTNGVDACVIQSCDIGLGPGGEVVDVGVFVGAVTNSATGNNTIHATTPTIGVPTVNLGNDLIY
jgi:hypothetical protein